MAGFLEGLAGGLPQGLQLGAGIRQMRRQNALQSLYQQQGPQIMQGDPQALGALAQYDPQQAFQFQQAAAEQKAAQRKTETERMARVSGMLYGVMQMSPEQRGAALDVAKRMAMESGLASPDQLSGVSLETLPHLVNQFRDIDKIAASSEHAQDYAMKRREFALKFGETIAPMMAGGGDGLVQRQPEQPNFANSEHYGPKVGAVAPPAPIGPDQRMAGARPVAPDPEMFGAGAPSANTSRSADLPPNIRAAYGRLIDNGVPEHAAAGIVGNLMQESLTGGDINPKAVGDGGNSFGAGQWNGPRAEALRAFARGRGADPSDLNTQVDFMMHEGRTTERAAWDAIMGAPDAATAARIASERYWRPGDPRNENRVRYAQRVSQAATGDPRASDGMSGGQGGDGVTEAIRALRGELPFENLSPAGRQALGRINAESGGKPTELMKNLEAAGLRQGSPEYQAAIMRKISGDRGTPPSAIQIAEYLFPDDSTKQREWVAANGGKSGFALETGPNGEMSFRMGAGAGAGGAGFERGTKSKLEQGIQSDADTLAQVNNVIRDFNPAFQQVQTRFGASWAAAKDMFGQASPEDQELIRGFSRQKADSYSIFNNIIREMSGAAVTESEAGRMEAVLPKVGEGLFDGDSPAQFIEKLEALRERITLALARKHYWQTNGATGNPWDVSGLDNFEDFIRNDLSGFAAEYRENNPNAGDGAVRDVVVAERKRRFGI